MDSFDASVRRWALAEFLARETEKDLFKVGLADVQAGQRLTGALDGAEYLLDVVASGAIVGTEFGRVVPNFVAQQRAIGSAPPLRDEVNRRGLTRGNLSWASSGLDTGRPGYTLGCTPQPHNEGDFTALGRITRGLDVVDRLELGDRITGARVVR